MRPGPSTYEWQEYLRSRITVMPVRCSSTSSRTSGSIFAASRTTTCAASASTISRTAAARPMYNDNTPSHNPTRICGLWRKLLGHHGQRRSGAGDPFDQGNQAAILRLRGSWRAPGSRRWQPRPVGGRRLTSLCARYRSTRAAEFRDPEAARERSLWFQGDIQRHDRGEARSNAGLDIAVSFRNQPGARRPHGRELPHRPRLEFDAEEPSYCHRASPGRLFRWLARCCRGSASQLKSRTATLSRREICDLLDKRQIALRIRCGSPRPRTRFFSHRVQGPAAEWNH